VSVPAQIAVLLALTAELFDNVPLDQIKDAEHAVRDAVADIPEEVRKRLDTADKLSDEDRGTIIQIARKSLARFQPKPEAKAEPKPEAKPGPKAKPQAESKPEVHSGVKPNANPETGEKS
jgi:F-type H+-transporting ATPase subunit alpha